MMWESHASVDSVSTISLAFDGCCCRRLLSAFVINDDPSEFGLFKATHMHSYRLTYLIEGSL